MPRLSTFALTLLSALPLAASVAHADTYKLYIVASTQSEGFVMGDDFGNYAFNSSFTFNHTNLCGTSSLDACYLVGNVFTGATSYSSTIPASVDDPAAKAGHADLPTGPGWSIGRELGNLFAGEYAAPGGTATRGIWDGSDPSLNLLSRGSLDGGFASANGNVFFIDGYDNTLVVGIDQQTSPVPEGGTLSLTATAVLAVAGLRRRLFCR